MEKLKAVQIPMPNFELQEQFAAFVAQVDKSKLLEQIRKITIRKEGITDDQL
jgi:restriction endonuclease S subunit